MIYLYSFRTVSTQRDRDQYHQTRVMLHSSLTSLPHPSQAENLQKMSNAQVASTAPHRLAARATEISEGTQAAVVVPKSTDEKQHVLAAIAGSTDVPAASLSSAPVVLPPKLDGARLTCPSSNRNAVLGAAFTYDVVTLRPFMRSMARASKSIDGVLFITGQPEPALAKEAARFGFRFFAEDITYKNEAVLKRLGFPSFDLKRKEIFRFLLYDEFLHRYQHCYDKVVIADTRDLYFQADPFTYVEDGLYVCQEEVKKDDDTCCELGEVQFNGRWNRGSIDCAKQNGANEIIQNYHKHKQTPILCSGVSLGTTAAMRSYFQAMIGYIQTQMTKTCHGLDQGIHQVLVYTDQIPGKITFLTNEEGPVFNMGSPCNHGQPQRDLPNYNPASPPPLPSASHKADPLFSLYNGNRTMVAAIVHQYDRCVYLRMRLHKFYQDQAKSEI